MAVTEKGVRFPRSFNRSIFLRVLHRRISDARRQSTQSEATRWDMLSRVDVKRIRRKQVSGIWYIPNPSSTDPLSIITKLPQLESNDRAILRRAIFLASPGLAGWFSPESSFHREAINWIYSPVLPKQPPKSYVAIVDALPSPEYFQQWGIRKLRPYAPAEGLAVCLLSSVQYSEADQDDREGPAVLRFRSQNSKAHDWAGERDVFSFLTLPLANTLFVNGLRNTAFYQRWSTAQKDGQPVLVPTHDPVTVTQIQLDILKRPHRLFRTDMPLYPLTPRRKVLSCMGNVIRQLQGDNGQIIGASAELEAIVPKLLAQQQKLDYEGSPEQPQIQIFARVMPPNTSTEGQQPVAEGDVKRVDNEENLDTRDNPSDGERQLFDTISSYETFRALRSGSKIYRVTSGGGGWGKKAGLLSLDQATDFEPTKAQESGLFPDPDADEETPDMSRKPEVGALVPPGYTVEFFAAKTLKPLPPYFMEQWRQPKDDGESKLMPEQWSESGTSKVLVGVVAASEEPAPDRVKEAARAMKISVLPGCFGVLSEGGVSVSVEKKLWNDEDGSDQFYDNFKYETLNRHRIDVPSATFQTKLRPFYLVEASKPNQSTTSPSPKNEIGDGSAGQTSLDGTSTALPISKVNYTPKTRGRIRLVRRVSAKS